MAPTCKIARGIRPKFGPKVQKQRLLRGSRQTCPQHSPKMPKCQIARVSPKSKFNSQNSLARDAPQKMALTWPNNAKLPEAFRSRDIPPKWPKHGQTNATKCPRHSPKASVQNSKNGVWSEASGQNGPNLAPKCKFVVKTASGPRHYPQMDPTWPQEFAQN